MNSLPSEPPGKPKNTGVGSLSLFPGDLPDPEIEPGSPELQADSSPAELPGKPPRFFFFFFKYINYLEPPSRLLFLLPLPPFFPSFPLQRWRKGVFSRVCKPKLKAGFHQHLCPPFELTPSSVRVQYLTCPFIWIGISRIRSPPPFPSSAAVISGCILLFFHLKIKAFVPLEWLRGRKPRLGELWCWPPSFSACSSTFHQCPRATGVNDVPLKIQLSWVWAKF